MKKTYKLRPHQKKMNKKVLKSLDKYSHILYGASVSFGKSVAIQDIVYKTIKNGERVLIIAPRRKLIFQLSSMYKDGNIAILMGTDSIGNPSTADIIIASLSTLSSRLKKNSNLIGNLGKIIIDEVHQGFNMRGGIPKTSAKALYDRYWNDGTKWIGFSATPIDSKGYRMEGWDKTIYKYDTAWLIREGWLAKFKYFSIASDIDMRDYKANSLTGEYKSDDVKEVTNTPTAITSVIKHYLSMRKSKNIIFASSIEHATLIYEELEKTGYSRGIKLLHSGLGDKEVNRIYAEFETNVIHTIINVGMLVTGFDDPEVEVIFLASPTASIIKFIQTCGRVLRWHKNIPTVDIIDLANIYNTLGILPDSSIDWNRKRKPKADYDADNKPENSITDLTLECRSCKNIFRMIDAKRETSMTDEVSESLIFCPNCGDVVDVKTTELNKVDEVKQIKTIADIDYSIKYSGEDLMQSIGELIKLNTRNAKTSWGVYIHKQCLQNDRKRYREIIYGYMQGIVSSKLTWRKLMEVYDK